MIVAEKELVKFIDINAGSVCLRRDGIIVLQIREDYLFNAQDINEGVRAIEQVGNGGAFPILVKSGKYTNITRDALDDSMDANNSKYAIATAVMVYSLHQKLLARVYFKFKKNTKPTRFFNNEDMAIEWLKSFITN